MYYLELTDSSGNTTKVSLFSHDFNYFEKLETEPSDIYVYSDRAYSVKIISADDYDLKKAALYINDEKVEAICNEDGSFGFEGYSSRSQAQLFRDCYGYVQLRLAVEADDNQPSLWFYTKYIAILVRRGELNDAVKRMSTYVYEHQGLLLFNEENVAHFRYSLIEKGFRTFESQLLLAEQIIEIYERNYGYFKANSRFKTEQVEIVDRIEKLQYATPNTVQYVARHPEYLRHSIHANSIRLGKSYYFPTRTVTSQIAITYDIYENQVIVAFLRTMISNVEELYKSIKQIKNRVPVQESLNEEYVFSNYIIYSNTIDMINGYLKRIHWLRKKYESALNSYSSLYDVKTITCVSMPKPTAVLLSVPQYNQIFTAIHKWFNYGTYDFEKEKFILSFIRVASLYECYTLAHMIEYLHDQGYNFYRSEKWVYPKLDRWRYVNTRCNNTFYFSKEDTEIVVYYQPIIYSDDRCINGISLYRNTSLSISSEGYTGSYYCPDYLVKYVRKSEEFYIIIDAKFSTLSNVRMYQVKSLAFKYLFSISPINEHAHVMGLCIAYGKGSEQDKSSSVYDKQLPQSKIMPFYELVPLSELRSEEQNRNSIKYIMNVFMETVKNDKAYRE